MALRKIVFENDPTLRKKSKVVTAFDERLATLLDDMTETMDKNNGVGLAAIQVGILKRAIVIDIGEGLIEAINPVIVSESGKQNDAEGCLSCPGQRGMVSRPQKVTVKAQDRNGKEYEIEAKGLLARAFCHEIDHLDGIIFKDRASEMLEPDDDEDYE
ncbi:MAG: peptide deformylase [Oscillospiraceae bacterium]